MSLPKRTRAEEWRPESAAEDTAPSPAHPVPSVESWGVTVEQARDLLRRQMCPACGEGPWKSPLNHASRKHGIDHFAMRDACGLTTRESVVEPEFSERIRERGRSMDMSAVTEASRRRGPQRWTSAGRQKNAAALVEWEESHPDAARAARSKAGQAGAAARRRYAVEDVEAFISEARDS